MTYADKLKDPRWQRKRLEVLNRENFTCENCGDATKTLHVHHGYYETGLDPWEYDSETLHCLCESCHTSANDLRLSISRSTATLSLHRQRHIISIIQVLSCDKLSDVFVSTAAEFLELFAKCELILHLQDRDRNEKITELTGVFLGTLSPCERQLALSCEQRHRDKHQRMERNEPCQTE